MEQNNKILLTEREIDLFNEVFSDSLYGFENFSNKSIGNNVVFFVLIRDTQKFESFGDDIKNLFEKFKDGEVNDCNGFKFYGDEEHKELFDEFGIGCSISKNITKKFPKDLDIFLDKNDLYDMFKERIDSNQHDKLIKKENVKNAINSYRTKFYIMNTLRANDKGEKKVEEFNFNEVVEFYKNLDRRELEQKKLKENKTSPQGINTASPQEIVSASKFNNTSQKSEEMESINSLNKSSDTNNDKPSSKFELSNALEWFKEKINSLFKFLSSCMPFYQKNDKDK